MSLNPLIPTSRSATPEVRLEVTSNPIFLSGIRELVHGVCRRLGFHEANCSQVALAVDEALCNVIRHGYDKRTDGHIWMSLYPYQVTAAGQSEPDLHLQIVLEDEARQVDPATIKSRDLSDIRPGGLGVHIIKEVMDEVRYQQRSPAGMRLEMLKKQGPTAKRLECCPDPECGDKSSGSPATKNQSMKSGGCHGER
ncbi:MAG: ATP-binding protein [Phycisphaerales bacterium]|nr:MAG: ATP-binding protein [Phycisphaerales bacterium]